VDEARAIYRELVLVHPSRQDLRAKLASLETSPRAGLAEEAAPEPVPLGVSAPIAASPAGDGLAETLQAWLAAVRDLRAERSRR